MTETPTTTAASPPRPSGKWLARIDQQLENASDWANPILVKEARQALKSQQFVIWFLLLLVGCWVVTIGGLAIIGPSAYYASSGGQMYQWYAWMLAFPLLVVVPFSAFRSLASEQEENTRDVLTVSALTPSQVVSGKLGSAALQMLIYLSAIAPCLGFTYLLRGIDALTLVLLPTLAVLASLGLSMIGIFLASLTTLKYLQILLSVAFVGLLLTLFWNTLWIIEEFINNGYRFYQDNGFWMVMGGLLTFYFTTFLIAYFAAVACNTFTSANRSTPLRVAVLIQQAAFIGWVAAMGFWQKESGVAAIMYLFAMVYWTFVGMIITGEKPILSPRVRRTLPSSELGRLFFTWLTPGPGTGYFFVLANMSFCLLLAMFTMRLFPGRFGIGSREVISLSMLFMTAYAIAYLGLGRLLIVGLRRLAELSLLGGFLIHLLLLLAGGALPYVIQASSNRFRGDGFSYLHITSPVAIFWDIERGRISSTEMLTTAIVVGAAALSMLLINLVMTAHEIRQTRLPLPQRVWEDDLLLNPAEEQKPTNPWGDTKASPPAQDG